MKKITIKASSDIALVKYWGKKDEVLRLPENGSVSIILDGLDTTTTVEFDKNLSQDIFVLEGEEIPSESREYGRVTKHLDRIRKLAEEKGKGKISFAKVYSENTFPRATGLSSSGSGMAALTYAATKAIDLDLSEKELSILSRQASGTACRCACGGFVEWHDGDTSETSFSETLFESDHWDIRDVIAVVSEGKKLISSTKGHTTAQSSPMFKERQRRISQKIKDVKQAIADKDFTKLGELVEAEALEFHSVLLTSTPPMIALLPGSIEVMHAVRKMREDGIEAYFTVNTGFNLHVLTLPKFEDEVEKRLKNLSLVEKTLRAKVGSKPREIDQHLF